MNSALWCKHRRLLLMTTAAAATGDAVPAARSLTDRLVGPLTQAIPMSTPPGLGPARAGHLHPLHPEHVA